LVDGLVNSVGVLVMCSRVKFHAPSSNGSLLNSVKPVTKEKYRTASLLLYILPKKKLYKNSIFSHDLLPYIVSGSKNVSGLMNSVVRRAVVTGC